MLAKRLQERHEDNFQEQIEARDRGKSYQQLEQVLADQGLLPPASSPESCCSTPAKAPPVTPDTHHHEAPPSKKKKVFVDINDNEDDLMPQVFQHIRNSEKNVKDEYYQTVANLVGKGLSVNESAIAVVALTSESR